LQKYSFSTMFFAYKSIDLSIVKIEKHRLISKFNLEYRLKLVVVIP
jgi:hypothetical protein